MKIEAFLEVTAPRAQRSALDKHAAEISRLRAAGMTLSQIQSYLLGNGLLISTASLSRFIKKQRAEKQPPAPAPEYLKSKDSPYASVGEGPPRPQGMTDAGWRDVLLARAKQRRHSK